MCELAPGVSRRWGWGLVFGRATGLDQLSEGIVCMCMSLCERQLKDQRMNGTAAGQAAFQDGLLS